MGQSKWRIATLLSSFGIQCQMIFLDISSIISFSRHYFAPSSNLSLAILLETHPKNMCRIFLGPPKDTQQVLCFFGPRKESSQLKGIQISPGCQRFGNSDTTTPSKLMVNLDTINFSILSFPQHSCKISVLNEGQTPVGFRVWMHLNHCIGKVTSRPEIRQTRV